MKGMPVQVLGGHGDFARGQNDGVLLLGTDLVAVGGKGKRKLGRTTNVVFCHEWNRVQSGLPLSHWFLAPHSSPAGWNFAIVGRST